MEVEGGRKKGKNDLRLDELMTTITRRCSKMLQVYTVKGYPSYLTVLVNTGFQNLRSSPRVESTTCIDY